MLSAIGFILVAVMVALIIRGKVALPPILVLLSCAAVVVLGLTGNIAMGDAPAAIIGPLDMFKAMKGYVDTGAKSVLNTVVLFTFAIVYFNILSDAGMFDVIVNKVMKKMGNSVTGILLMTCFLVGISHLDGSGATTMLISIPTMLPMYKKMKISPVILLGIVGLWSGIENMLPWTSALARVSAATGVEPYDLWRSLFPVQIVGFIIMIIGCFVLGKILKNKGCGMTDEEFNELKAGMGQNKEPVLKVSNTVLYIDMAMTVILVVALLLGWVNTNVAFMIVLSIALLLNCKGTEKESVSKQMTGQIRKHGSTALNMVMILFCIGMLVGVMKDTGMMTAMTNTLVGLIPESMGSHISFIVSLLSVPLSMFVGSDSLYMIMAPIFAELAITFGGTAAHASGACVIGACLAANLCLVAPTPYLALGLAGVEMKDNLKYLFIPTWILGIVLAIVGAVVGVYPF